MNTVADPREKSRQARTAGIRTEAKERKVAKSHYFSNLDLRAVASAIPIIEAMLIEQNGTGRFSVDTLPALFDELGTEIELQGDSRKLANIKKVLFTRAAIAIVTNRDYATIELIASAMVFIFGAEKTNKWRKHWISLIQTNSLPNDQHDLGVSYCHATLEDTGTLLLLDKREPDVRKIEHSREAVSKLKAAWNLN